MQDNGSVLSQVTTTQPITLDDIKNHLNIDISDTTNDAFLTETQKTAIQWFEKQTNFLIYPATIKTYFQKFGKYVLPYRNITSFTSILYTPETWDYIEGSRVAFTDYFYVAENTMQEGTVLMKKDITFPTLFYLDCNTYEKAIELNYTGGYSDFTNLQADIKKALLHMITVLFNNLGDTCVDCNSFLTDPLVYGVIDIYQVNIPSIFTINGK